MKNGIYFACLLVLISICAAFPANARSNIVDLGSVRIVTDQNGKQYQILPGQGYIIKGVNEEFAINLPLSFGKRYEWTMVEPQDKNIIERIEVQPEVTIDQQTLGKATVTQWKFKALSPGRTQVRAAYGPKGSDKREMEKIFVVIIN